MSNKNPDRPYGNFDTAAGQTLKQLSRMMSRLEAITSFCDQLNVGACTKEELVSFIADIATSLDATMALVSDAPGQIPLLKGGHWAHEKLY